MFNANTLNDDSIATSNKELVRIRENKIKVMLKIHLSNEDRLYQNDSTIHN